jgi:hypothetical protein
MVARHWRRYTAVGVLLALALVVAGPIHLEEESQSGDHCAVCHLRHVSILAAQESLSTVAAMVVEPASSAEPSGDEQSAYRQLHPSRGPPA